MPPLKDRNTEKAIEMAQRLGTHADEVEEKKVEDKLPAMNRGPIAKVWNKVQDLYRAFLSEETPNALKTLIIGGLLYLVIPLDVVPDVIPVAGLLDDAAVIGFLWKKLSDLARIGAKVAVKSLPVKVEEQVTKAYAKAFAAASLQLETLLNRQVRRTMVNCAVSLSAFLVALLFLSLEGELPFLLASLCILITLIHSLYSFLKVLPNLVTIVKIWWKKRTVNATIAQYLRQRYPFIVSLESMKAKIKVLDGIPSLETMVSMQQKAMQRKLISVGLTVITATAFVFVLRHMLLSMQTPYSFTDLLSYPFVRLWSLFRR
jgi:uncharacterized membrane protein YkvA (DUF1232 family)